MDQKRVVVTGVGTVNPLANNVNETWNSLVNGKSGITKIDTFDTEKFNSKIAGLVKNYDFTNFCSVNNANKAKKLDPFVHYAIGATQEAVIQSGIDFTKNPDRAGICIGSGIGGLHIQHQNSVNLFSKGPRRVSPFYIPGQIGNICSGFLSIEHGIKGPNLSLQTACATGNHSIGIGLMLIQSNMADVMIVGGSEAAVNEIAVAGFGNMRALSTNFNDTPEKASRPFDKKRDGFVIAEGAGVLIIESYEHAKARNADILCELLSVGMTGDAHDLVMPHPEGLGALKSMQMSLDIANINSNQIDYINTHGTSTPLGDIGESKAILKLLNDDQSNVTVGSTKSMTGHLLGATSGLEAIASVMSIKNDIIPPTINLDELDERTGLTSINTQTQEKEVNIALSNSFGFGGHNSTLCLKKI
jgi:3-oxoacyl-[acyl-carrier-protein] synthase II